MKQIKCDVKNCSHNSNCICYADRIDIGGHCASDSCGTCCGSFLDETVYSSLTDSTESSNDGCDSIICTANTCIHNCNNECKLDSIKVSSDSSDTYVGTKCTNFELQ